MDIHVVSFGLYEVIPGNPSQLSVGIDPIYLLLKVLGFHFVVGRIRILSGSTAH